MTADNHNDTYELMRELINAKDALHELASLTPDGLPEDAGIANGTLLKMVADRIDRAAAAYISSTLRAIDWGLEAENTPTAALTAST